MHRVDAVGNSPGVRRELVEDIGSLPGWRKGVRQKKTKTRRKIVRGSRKTCRERFAEGIGKLAVNTSGDRRKKTGRLAARMSEAAGLAGVELNWLTRGLVNIRFKPKFEKWREPLLWKFRRVYRRHPGFWAANDG
ncbi:hypothetical protein BHM03_00053303 [Ensete ventricosum]|nr:hypothetical protein BHM03_00053303 [Ensete ventricosum]